MDKKPKGGRPYSGKKAGGAAAYKYSGKFDLVDSFEDEEKKKRSAENRETPNVARRGKGSKGKASASGNAGRSRVKNGQNRQKNPPAAPARVKKTDDYEEERERSFSTDDSFIKTRANREYIPFDTGYDDDDAPDEFFTQDEEYTERRSSPRRGKAHGRGVELEGGIPGAVAGRNAVRELLRSGRSVDKIYVKSGSREGSIVVIVAEAVSKKIPIVEVTQEKLTQIAGGTYHQGVVALAAEKQYTDIDTILKIAKDRGEKPLIVIADGIEDPQNLGAMIRCAECAGAHGIIIPKRRAVGLTPIVAKASAGAIEHVAIAKVTNLSDAVIKLQKAGVWVFAAEADGTPYYETDFNVPAAIILGSEGFGVGHLLKERADATVSIPMYGNVNSLNVSAAAAVLLCHAARMQRKG